MNVDPEIIQAFLTIALAGGFAGLVGGYFGGRTRLLGAILLGMIGGISASAIARIAGFPGGFTVGDGFSLAWALAGGLVLGFVVAKSTA
ncbi:MAG TPA: hypothetical protein VM470_01470 [Acidimicrobiia bacterium]|nr:hypothetical protein [Acidimicrobiia bacterium]